MLTEEWNVNNSTDRANKIIGEVQLRKYGKLLESYTNRLRNLEESFADGSPIFTPHTVTINLVPKERCEIVDLVDTDNKILNKVISVLAALCLEVKERKHEASRKFYNALLFFGEESENEAWVPQMATSKFLPKLQEISSFVSRCQQLVLEIVQQLAVIYTLSPNNQIINATCLHFEDIMDHLGELLVVLVTLDELVTNLDKIHENWAVYKRIIHTVQLPVPKERLITLEGVVKDLETTVLSGKIFQNTIDKLNEVKSTLKNSRLPEEFNLYFKNMLSVLETKNLESAPTRNNYSLLWIKVNCLFVLNFYLVGLHDKKIFRQVWEVCKRFVCVNLVGNAIWFPDKFLLQHFSHTIKQEDKKHIQAIANIRLELLNNQSQNLQSDVLKYSVMTCVWIIQLKAVLMQDTNNLKLEDLKGRAFAFLRGAEIATEISTHVKMIMNLYAALAKPMTKATVLSLCKLIELLKCIEHSYQQYYFIIAISVSHVMQYLAYQTLVIVSTAKKRLIGDKTYTKKHLDTLSALVLVEKILHGPITAERYLIGRLALSIARGSPNKVLKDDEVDSIYTYLNNLDGIRKIQLTVHNVCDTSFVYLHRVLLPIYFQHITENKLSCQRLYYMLCSISDSVLRLHRNDQISLTSITESFKKEIDGSLAKYTIQPLCQEIETDLRLQVHSHLQKDRNLIKSDQACKDFVRLILLSPVKLFTNFVSIKGHIENYLDTTFYNLTTVALHDWKTYGEMKSLAYAKYGIVSVQNHLPYQTLEQGLDVLEIMRNIHIFVSKYLYNLNNQIFIEQSSNNKHLNTINIRHISNSIRMHGIGIMNTTVNFTYQFLRKKFYIFSQFLFDEQIKSRLTKDLLYFREHKTQLDQKYSYEKADKFNKGIRKLGLSPDGLSYLDQFRILISQIGNAMGYVRMIRSGGMHCCSNSLSFIPDLEDIINYGDMTKSDNLSEATCIAAQRLDFVINDLTKNFAEGTQYFKLLVDVFANDFRNPKNSHLQNFYVIIPALTINFVECMIAAKDKINRRNKVGATFTDDGFAMGLAYVLKLLEQNKQFEGLHWFQSVKDKHKRDKASLVKPSVTEEKLRTTMLLTAKRLDTFQQEFDLLYFSLSSARIFFQKQVDREP